MKEFNEAIIKVLEDAGFNIGEITEQDGEYYVELSQYTPAGEDWYVIIWFDGTDEDFIKSVRTCYNNFDVDDEVAPYIEMRGQRGVPNSISALLEDAKWKEQKLEELYDALEALDLEEAEDDEEEEYTITLKVVDGGKAVWVTSNEDPNGEEAEFDKITDRNDQMLIALATYLGFEPAEVLNLDSIKKAEAAAGKEPWKIFYIGDLHGLQEVMSYTIRGEGEDEEQVTKQDLAFQFGCTPQEIIVKVEMR